MFKYNNTHIFTGYLKQLLSSFNLPACRVYTHEFAKYLEQYGKEDPRILESFDNVNDDKPDEGRLGVRINYLKNNELYTYFWDKTNSKKYWKHNTNVYYSSDKTTCGLTRTLNSPGRYYDTVTHEYLGDYLRFMRDYYNINLMSMYNCFNNKIYSNVYFNFTINPNMDQAKQVKATFDAQDPNYRIYAVPVKLFSEYTIAIDCAQGIELFCGLYNTVLDVSDKAKYLAAKTYKKINKPLFSQPYLYDKLSIANWPIDNDIDVKSMQQTKPVVKPVKPNTSLKPGIGKQNGQQLTPAPQYNPSQIRTDIFTRWDIACREQDLRLFIKVPVSCKSSITILEGDYRNFNDAKFAQGAGTVCIKCEKTATTVWHYDENLQTYKTTIRGEDYMLGVRNPETFLGVGTVKVSDDPAVRVGKTSDKLVFSIKSTNYYLDGGFWLIDYLSSTVDEASAANVVIEALVDKDNSYYLALDANGNKTYINVATSNEIRSLVYKNNHSILNFNTKKTEDNIDLNNYSFKPISKLQLLAFNTGESYPFADRLVEYLSSAAILPIDDIPDNIKRAQKVMNQNGYYFQIDGLWENKMQNIIYDYIVGSGPMELVDNKLQDKRQGYHRSIGHNSKSTLYDVLGYVDKDAEKWYASWETKDGKKAQIKDNIQNVDIYDGLYDI